MMTETMGPADAAISERLFFHLPQIRTPVGLVFGSGALTALVAQKAAQAYHEKRVQRFIVSGHANTDFLTTFLPLIRNAGLTPPKENEPEGSYAARTMVDLGVPADAIVIDNAATNTAENVSYAMSLGLQEERSVTLFSLAHAQRRCLATVRNAHPEIVITTTPVFPMPGVNKRTWPMYSMAVGQVRDENRKLDDYIAQGQFKDADIFMELQRVNAQSQRQGMLAQYNFLNP